MINTTNIKLAATDRKIYHDLSGKRIEHGDFVYLQNINGFGIAEYGYINIHKANLLESFAKTNNRYDTKIEGKCPGIFCHFYKKTTKFNTPLKGVDSYQLHDSYHEDFLLQYLVDKQIDGECPMVSCLVLNKDNIIERFSEEDYQLFLDIRKQILSNKNQKEYNHYEIERN